MDDQIDYKAVPCFRIIQERLLGSNLSQYKITHHLLPIFRSAGQFLTIETFRRVPQNGAGIRPRLAQVTIPAPESTPPPAPRSPRATAVASPAAAARPPTACSSTSQSLDRRKLHLPQVTFSKEVGNGIIV